MEVWVFLGFFYSLSLMLAGIFKVPYVSPSGN